MFFDFSNAFNSIQLRLLKDKLENMQVDSPLVTWVDDYLMGKRQFVKLQNCTALSRVICKNSLLTCPL